jgi:hypothetical protein
MGTFTPAEASITAPADLRPPVKVAPFKQAASTSLRRECAELGICQGFEPPCGLCAAHGERDEEQRMTVQDVAYWGAICALGTFTLFTVFGIIGFFSVMFF